MARRPSAPMPESLRHFFRAQQHPARSVPCTHCGARAHRPCIVPSNKRQLPQPHPCRVSDWARQTACCPACQAEPGTACHDDGKPLATVHARRYQEAEETCA
ncbi:zinc finger domain-containing protein [Streptomyces mexicanus]|uniref:zinc finger domain-containing protein n=1 Tax=Streptomyces mexicanus TaxID=178566 RepID=UPI00364E7F1A